MSILQDTLLELDLRRGGWPAICEETGISYSWLCKFAQGSIKNPGIRTVEQLDAYFRDNPRPEKARGAA